MVIELRIVQFWSEIILVISNRTRAARSFDFEITRMISDQIALHSVQLPLFIDNDTRHHSGQNVVDIRGAAEWVCNKFWPLWWRVSSIKLYTTLNHIRFVFLRNERNKICLDNWTHRLGFKSARAALRKWAACTRQTLSKTFADSTLGNYLSIFSQLFWGKNYSASIYLVHFKFETVKYTFMVNVSIVLDFLFFAFLEGKWCRSLKVKFLNL